MPRAAPVVAVALLVAACDAAPTTADLEARIAAARAANSARLAGRKAAPEASWSLRVEGIAGKCKHRSFSLDELRALPGVDVRATNADHLDGRADTVTFHGAAVARLLDDCAIPPDVATITFLAYDGYRSTVRAADARHAPIALAYARDGQPIVRSAGGPLRLVFPSFDDEAIAAAYPSVQWAYYVTHMIVGTTPASLRVGARTFNRDALAALPLVTRVLRPRWRVGWPGSAARLIGVRATDLLREAGVAPPARGRLRVVELAPYRGEPGAAFSIAADAIAACDPVVTFAVGDGDGEPIDAERGGPLVLALADGCPGHANDAVWPTFVEGLTVEEGP